LLLLKIQLPVTDQPRNPPRKSDAHHEAVEHLRQPDPVATRIGYRALHEAGVNVATG